MERSTLPAESAPCRLTAQNAEGEIIAWGVLRRFVTTCAFFMVMRPGDNLCTLGRRPTGSGAGNGEPSRPSGVPAARDAGKQTGATAQGTSTLRAWRPAHHLRPARLRLVRPAGGTAGGRCGARRAGDRGRAWPRPVRGNRPVGRRPARACLRGPAARAGHPGGRAGKPGPVGGGGPRLVRRDGRLQRPRVHRRGDRARGADSAPRAGRRPDQGRPRQPRQHAQSRDAGGGPADRGRRRHPRPARAELRRGAPRLRGRLDR